MNETQQILQSQGILQGHLKYYFEHELPLINCVAILTKLSVTEVTIPFQSVTKTQHEII